MFSKGKGKGKGNSEGEGDVSVKDKKPVKLVKLKFLRGRILIFWDAENCSVPKEMGNAGNIPIRIKEKFREKGYIGEIEITVVVSHRSTFGEGVAEALESIGVHIADFNTIGQKDLANFILMDLITNDMLNRIPPPATLFVISGDYRFANILEDCQKIGYNVMSVWRAGDGAAELEQFSGPCVWEELVA